MNSLSVDLKNGPRESKQVFNSAPVWLPRNPQLKVFRSVVVPDSVLVMNALAFGERAAKCFFHDESMNELSLAAPVNILANIAPPINIGTPGPDVFLGGTIAAPSLPVHEAPSVGRVLAITALDSALSFRLAHPSSIP
jgi:hypothetical protein